MGTGIVSVGLASDHRHTLSLVLLAIAAAIWLVLASVVVWRALRDRPRLVREARSPAALTGVAATAVLGARATGLGWSAVAAALLVIAAVTWVVLCASGPSNRSTPATGVSFMLTVSTQSLAVLAAQLATRAHAAWLLYAALALFALGLVMYVLVLARFDFRELIRGAGDHWVSGGALAISTLAAARITLGTVSLHRLTSAHGSLQTLTLVLWAASVAWIPVLLCAEIIRPRLSYDIRRWATVFPLGMYAACSFDAGLAAHAPGLLEFARVWLWIGFAAWVAVFSATIGRVLSLLARERPAAHPRVRHLRR